MALTSHVRWTKIVVAAAVLSIVMGALPGGARASVSTDPAGGFGVEQADTTFAALQWTFFKRPQGQPACVGVSLGDLRYWNRRDCGFGEVIIGGTAAGNTVQVGLFGPDGTRFALLGTTRQTDDGAWRFILTPDGTWPAGVITTRVVQVNNVDGNYGETTFFHNLLGATLSASFGTYRPGDPIPVTGALYELWDEPSVFIQPPGRTNVPGTFKLRVVSASGEDRGTFGPFTADKGGDGLISETIPGSATAGLTATRETGYRTSVAIEVVDAAYNDVVTAGWAAQRAGAGGATLHVTPDALILENSFVSSVGWVKPGETYPFRVFVKNFMSEPKANAVVTLPAADGMSFTNVTTVAGSGTATISGGSIVWNVGSVPAATDAGPAIKTLVVEARAKGTRQDPEIVWKDLSTTATLSYDGGPSGITARSHGPKVIPEGTTYDTARYGDRPFAVVPVDYFDRKHDGPHNGQVLQEKINSADIPGSTFNLYQEMSYGQLFPQGTVPSSAIATAGWDVQWNSPRYQQSGFQFTALDPRGACTGVTFKDFKGTDLYRERINDGWYQLPGDTGYYGSDRTTIAGALVLGSSQIDSACGQIGKAVYDAAHIADPEIDYSDYDTDKDGVVDFFMMVFVGLGGNGDSQINGTPPYDNIWPHSSSLEFYYEDKATGLTGYISDDQLKDHLGRPLYYVDDSFGSKTTTPTAYPVYVRVGPYNVNPESAIDNASVISHEYGHSLGLPDFYSSSLIRETYGDWNLMATDKSQNMDVFSKQELGWLVPTVLPPGETTVTGFGDSKINTHRIDWVRPDGTPYTLSGPGVNNGQAFVAKLPSRLILDPAKVEANASPTHVWWSQKGNDFNCAPAEGHNLDVFLPELATIPAGTPITLTFKSLWDIEWDFDYGFVLVTTDGGTTYRSVPSQKGFTTPSAINPTDNQCLKKFDNGLTGTTASYTGGTAMVDRAAGRYPDSQFAEDSYDLSFAAGQTTVLRFSYSTDAGLARPGWFIDDVKITAGDRVIYQSGFESGANDPRLFNGGCQGGAQTGLTCTDGWQYVDTAAGDPADHAYYLEMRDRSGFDFDGRGENDRAAIAFQPGLLLVYTDENHGYGNVGTPDPPAQTPLDSTPDDELFAPLGIPNLNDAAFTAAAGKNRYSDSGTGWRDNYSDPDSEDGLWHFRWDCLTFEVLSMDGNADNSADAFDLIGDVKFTLGPGCAPFDYGNIAPPNALPTVVIQTKPPHANVNSHITFDGSASSDDTTPLAQLGFEWDLNGDGVYDATGQTLKHNYKVAGTYVVRLRVTDADGASAVGTKTVTVRHP